MAASELAAAAPASVHSEGLPMAAPSELAAAACTSDESVTAVEAAAPDAEIAAVPTAAAPLTLAAVAPVSAAHATPTAAPPAFVAAVLQPAQTEPAVVVGDRVHVWWAPSSRIARGHGAEDLVKPEDGIVVAALKPTGEKGPLHHKVHCVKWAGAKDECVRHDFAMPAGVGRGPMSQGVISVAMRAARMLRMHRDPHWAAR